MVEPQHDLILNKKFNKVTANCIVEIIPTEILLLAPHSFSSSRQQSHLTFLLLKYVVGTENVNYSKLTYSKCLSIKAGVFGLYAFYPVFPSPYPLNNIRGLKNNKIVLGRAAKSQLRDTRFARAAALICFSLPSA